jgi:uncharacterized membrane protein YhdT
MIPTNYHKRKNKFIDFLMDTHQVSQEKINFNNYFFMATHQVSPIIIIIIIIIIVMIFFRDTQQVSQEK